MRITDSAASRRRSRPARRLVCQNPQGDSGSPGGRRRVRSRRARAATPTCRVVLEPRPNSPNACAAKVRPRVCGPSTMWNRRASAAVSFWRVLLRPDAACGRRLVPQPRIFRMTMTFFICTPRFVAIECCYWGIPAAGGGGEALRVASDWESILKAASAAIDACAEPGQGVRGYSERPRRLAEPRHRCRMHKQRAAAVAGACAISRGPYPVRVRRDGPRSRLPHRTVNCSNVINGTTIAGTSVRATQAR